MGRVWTEKFNEKKISMSVVAAGRIALPSPDGVALSGLETVVARFSVLCVLHTLYTLLSLIPSPDSSSAI